MIESATLSDSPTDASRAHVSDDPVCTVLKIDTVFPKRAWSATDITFPIWQLSVQLVRPPKKLGPVTVNADPSAWAPCTDDPLPISTLFKHLQSFPKVPIPKMDVILPPTT